MSVEGFELIALMLIKKSRLRVKCSCRLCVYMYNLEFTHSAGFYIYPNCRAGRRGRHETMVVTIPPCSLVKGATDRQARWGYDPLRHWPVDARLLFFKRKSGSSRQTSNFPAIRHPAALPSVCLQLHKLWRVVGALGTRPYTLYSTKVSTSMYSSLHSFWWIPSQYRDAMT